jgi:hypothetical protein
MKSFASILFAILLASCAFKATPPDGFSPYLDNGFNDFRAVSADGVVYKVSAYDNDPEASPEFWRESLKSRMQYTGYLLTDSTDGYLYTAPQKWGDQSYYLYLLPTESHIIVVEAAGEASKFAAHKEAIVNAAKKVEAR